MKCHCCGGKMHARHTDMPFKLDDRRMVIIKELPILQCGEYLLEDAVMARVEQSLKAVDTAAELEIVRFAA